MISGRRSASRADEVRARRAKEMKQRVLVASDVARKPAPYTPIQARAGEDVLPIIQKPRKRVRRKFYYQLFNGLEIKLPAIPVFNPGWRMVSAVIFMASGFSVYSMLTSPVFTVSEVKLNGAARVTQEEIEAILPVKGEKILTVTPRSLENVITNTYPIIADAHVTVGWPASVSVTVSERVPVLAWEQDHATHWIAADGVAFEPQGDPLTLTTIYADGNPPSGGYNLQLVTQESKKPLASLALPKQAGLADQGVAEEPTPIFIDPALIPGIEQIAGQAPQGTAVVYDPSYGLGWADPAGWQVFFGMQPDQMPQKLATYQVIVADLKRQGIRPNLISLANLYAPYYRLEQ